MWLTGAMYSRALVYRSFGSPLDCLSRERSRKAPRRDGKLRVKMTQAPINPSDLIPVTGAYAHRIALPMVAGYEGVGRVVSAPSSQQGLIGRRVLPLRGEGTWQTYVDCDPGLAIPVPERVADDVAARAYINPMAASQMLARWTVVGRRVLLCGVGSHCADLLGYWARQRGAREVVGIYRSEARVPRLRSLGNTPLAATDEDEIIRYARTADVTFDSLGGPLASKVLDNMRGDTRFVGYGLLTGVPFRPVRPPVARFERFHLRDALAAMDVRAWQNAFGEIWDTLAALKLPAPSLFPVRDWAEAVAQTERPGGAKPILCF